MSERIRLYFGPSNVHGDTMEMDIFGYTLEEINLLMDVSPEEMVYIPNKKIRLKRPSTLGGFRRSSVYKWEIIKPKNESAQIS